MGEQTLLCLAGIIVFGALAQWLAWLLRIPAILFLLGTGLAAGPGLGLLNPDELFGQLLLPAISLGVAVILFEGGLSLQFRELRGVRGVLIRLLSIGVVLTMVGVAVSVHYAIGLDWPLAFALGAILTVTGPTVVGPLLRDIRLSGRVNSLLRWEGIVIDPLGALLAAMVVLVIRSGSRGVSVFHVLGDLAGTLLVGGAIGLVAAALLVMVMRRYWAPDRLHSPLTLAVVVGVYALGSQMFAEAGLVAVTVLGVALANQSLVQIKHIIEFKETLVVILLSGLFIILGARIHPEEVVNLGVSGLLFVALLVLVVRPVAIAASTIGTELTFRERAFLAGMAPRGVVAVAIASVFASELVAAEIPNAHQLLSATVLSVIGTVLVYGLLGGRWARLLKLVDPNPQGILFVGASQWVRRLAKAISDTGVVVTLIDTDRQNVSAARMLGLTIVHGSALSEHLIEELDISRLKRLVATTPNVELNALVCQRYSEFFGRGEVYHLSAGPESGRHITVAPEQRGRELLTPEWTYSAIAHRYGENGEVRATKLTSEFTFGDWVAMNGEVALPVFLLKKDSSLIPFTELGPKPSAGDTIIALYTA